MEAKSSNVVWHERVLSRRDHERRNGHRSLLFWFTGLSGSGKSTLAHAFEESLFRRGVYTYVLDGDNIRHGLNGDLGFGPDDRKENIRRIGEVAKLFVDAGVVTLTAFISPFRADRARVRELLGSSDFVEVYVKCALDTCEARDPKGLYRKARAGEIRDFTGITSPYEEPEAPEIVMDTGLLSLEEAVEQLLAYWDRVGSPIRGDREGDGGRVTSDG